MKSRNVFAVFIALLFIVPVIFIQPKIAQGRDWALQISDPKDSSNDLDIKSIYARDDNNYLYFKVESYGNWNFEKNNGSLGIYVDTDGQTEPDENNLWVLAVMDIDGTYEGFVMDLNNGDIFEPIEVDFKKDSKIGTMKVDKKVIKLKTSRFSMSSIIISLSRSSDPYDFAPDDFRFVVYKQGGAGAGAKLGVSTKTIDLGVLKYDDSSTGNFDILNEGEGEIIATLKSSSNISLSSEEVTVGDYGSENIIVNINANKLTSKTYSENIDIQSKFGSATVNVTFEILPKPVLNVDMELLEFGPVIKGEKKSEKIKVSNKVKGPIRGSISATNKAILISKSSFDSDSEEVTISISTKNLEAGPLDGKIKIVSNGGSAIIDVTAEIINAMTIDKTEFDFGEINLDDPIVNPIQFTIQNQTNQTIALKMTTTHEWISIGSEITFQPKESKEIKVSIKLDKMESINTTYEGSILFETKYDKQLIPIKAYLKQDPPKTLWVRESSDQKSVNEKLITGKIWEKTFTIKNDGSGSMTVSAKWENSNSDFRLFNAKFVLKKGEMADIKVKLDSTGIKLDTYKNTLIIESNGGDLSIPINIEIIPKPIVMIRLFIGLSFAYIDQQNIKLDAPPYIKKGTTMVPLRFISDAFKAKIEWLSIGKGRIVLTIPSKSIQLDIGENFAFINGEKLPLQAPPEIKTGRTFVSVRFIAEGLGAKIEWKAETQQITIFYTIDE